MSSSQIEQLRMHFNSLNNIQKKAFIDNLKQKLQTTSNAEYTKLLNECIQKYNTSVRGVSTYGNDFDDLLNIGGGSVADIAFERRIEDYENTGYNLIKRNNNSVHLRKMGKRSWIFVSISFLSIVLYFVCIIIFTPSVSSYSQTLAEMQFKENFTKNMITYALIFAPLCIGAMISAVSSSKVVISMTKTNKIQEHGNVLKKK